MFTGIIEELGEIQTISQKKVTVLAEKVLNDTKLGDSIAVNGVCLTVTRVNSDSFDADISPETMKVTALSYLEKGSLVNLERAVQVGSRLGGHIVSGHTDSVAVCKYIKKIDDFYNISIEIQQELIKYVVKKGSITVDGISLTVANVQDNIVLVAVIPHTFENTNLKTLKIGDFVNIEMDILAKYVEKFLSTSDNKSGMSIEFLKENGFCEV